MNYAILKQHLVSEILGTIYWSKNVFSPVQRTMYWPTTISHTHMPTQMA